MFGENLRKARKDKQLTLEQLASIYNKNFDAGMSKGTLSKYENGKQEPMISVVNNLSSILDVSVDFLLDNIPPELIPYNPIMHKIPILGDIAAGLPIFAEENIEGYTYTDLNHGGKYFALRVKGDSMTAANIPDGSLVTVRVQPQVENGEIAAVRVNNDSFTVKRFKQDGNVIMLLPQSYNPEHQVQIYDLKKDKINIVGKIMKCEVDF